MARYAWARRSGGVRASLRLLPRALALLSAQRAARRLFRRLVGPSLLRVTRWPLELRISDSLTARSDPGGSACALYTGAFEELLRAYTHRNYRAFHAQCRALGDERCEWQVRLSAT